MQQVARRLRLLGLVALLVVALTGCLNPEEQSLFDKVNALRAANGVRALGGNNDLDAKAQAWARQMAADNRMYHSNLTDGLSQLNWRALGENVAWATDGPDVISRIHTLLTNSAPHRANMLNPAFTHVGIGVARAANGNVYVAEVFAAL